MGLFSQGGVDQGAILGMINKERGAAMGDLSNAGAQSAEDIRYDYGAAEHKALANLVSSGMSNSTVPSSLMAGFAREKSNSLRRLMESLSTQRASLRQGFAGMQAQAMEIPEQAGMGWGILGSILGTGGALGGAFLGKPPVKSPIL